MIALPAGSPQIDTDGHRSELIDLIGFSSVSICGGLFEE